MLNGPFSCDMGFGLSSGHSGGPPHLHIFPVTLTRPHVLSVRQVKSLELRLEASKAQTAEAKQAATEELASRLSVHNRKCTALETAASAAEEGMRIRPEHSSFLAFAFFTDSLVESGTMRNICLLRGERLIFFLNFDQSIK